MSAVLLSAPLPPQIYVHLYIDVRAAAAAAAAAVAAAAMAAAFVLRLQPKTSHRCCELRQDSNSRSSGLPPMDLSWDPSSDQFPLPLAHPLLCTYRHCAVWTLTPTLYLCARSTHPPLGRSLHSEAPPRKTTPTSSNSSKKATKLARPKACATTWYTGRGHRECLREALTPRGRGNKVP